VADPARVTSGWRSRESNQAAHDIQRHGQPGAARVLDHPQRDVAADVHENDCGFLGVSTGSASGLDR